MNPLNALAAWVTNVVQTAGYPGIATMLALENIFPPLPSELVLPLAGFLAGQGRLSLVGVVLAATLGSVIGALVLYGAGWWLGEARVRSLVRRYGRFLLLDEDDLDRARGWFDRHGTAAVVIGRVIPLVRSIVSIPAGVSRMNIGLFILYTTVGSGVWNVALIGGGWLLGTRWTTLERYAGYVGYAVTAALAVALARFVWQRLRHRPPARDAREPSDR